jgi:putative peptide zinc metalloprotease protein
LSAPPPLRDTIKIRRIVQRGEVTHVIKEPDKQTYFRFDEAQFFMLGLFDGNRDVSELVKLFNKTNTEYEYDEETLNELVSSVKDFRLLQRSKEEERVALVEKLKEQRKGRFLQAKGSLLHMRFHLHDPNEFFDRIISRMQWVWSPFGVKLSLILIAVSIVMILIQIDRFVADFERVFFFAQQGGWNIFNIWLVALGGIAFHEIGHGLTCKHYGGDVDDMGFLLLAFQPCLYCNVNDAWLFENNRHKIYVALAGVWIELVLAAIGVFIWTVVDVDNLLGRISFILATVATASSLFLNLNPLMKFDGYYILSDIMEIPNLRQNSLDWFSYSLKKHLFRLDEDPPFVPSAREKRIYFNYGLLIVLYLTIMLSGMAYLGYALIAQAYGTVGVVLFLLLVAKFVKMMTGKWSETLKEVVMKSFFSTPLRRLFSTIVGIFFVAALFLWSPHVVVFSDGEVDAETLQVHAPDNGFIKYVGYRQDRSLIGKEGESLFILDSPDLTLEKSRLMSQMRGMELDHTTTMSLRERDQTVDIKYRSLRLQIDNVIQKIRNLDVVVPAGRWLVDGPPPQTMSKRYFGRGETVFTLMHDRYRSINVVLEQSDLALIRIGNQVRVRLSGSPKTIFNGEVETITPVAKMDGPNRLFQLRIKMDVPDHIEPPPPSMTGEVRILGEKAPLWAHILRPIRSTFRIDLWL